MIQVHVGTVDHGGFGLGEGVPNGNLRVTEEPSQGKGRGSRRAAAVDIVIHVALVGLQIRAFFSVPAVGVEPVRFFEDGDGQMNLSLLDTGGEALVVSQFTLYGDASHGRRPSFSEAAPPELAEKSYLEFVKLLQNLGVRRVATGRFRAEMEVSLCNDGPVTIMVESR